MTDVDGYYVTPHRNRGKPSYYRVNLLDLGVSSEDIRLKGQALVEAHYDVETGEWTVIKKGK